MPCVISVFLQLVRVAQGFAFCKAQIFGKQLIFAATEVTEGALMKGVRFFGEGTRTPSVIFTKTTGKVRFIENIHLEQKADVKVRFA